MALAACCGPAKSAFNLRALVALGLPISADGRDYYYPCLQDCTIPKLFLSGNQDQYAPAAQLAQVAASAADPKRLVLIPGADHFFTGQIEPMQSALNAWLKEQSL
jgi:alpha/beta superfamily hydrolase